MAKARRRRAKPQRVSLQSVERSYERWRRIHADPPPLLFHYSRAAGVEGVLRSGDLWATNCRFTNDPSEMRYAIALARAVIREEFGHALSGLRGFRNWLSDALREYEDNARVYIACFCENGDLLSQWRGYGADGGGYALGFRSAALRNVQPWPDGLVRLSRVLYDSKTQKRALSSALRTVIALTKRLARLPDDRRRRDQTREAWLWFHEILAEWLTGVKDPAYQEEQEWRLIVFGRIDRKEVLPPRFRTTAQHAIPYVEVPLARKSRDGRVRAPIREIRYGPTLEPAITERSLRLLLEKSGLDPEKVRIRRSRVPFRG